MHVVVIGKKANDRRFVARYLELHGYTCMRLSDGATRVLRILYGTRPHEYLRWELRTDFYDLIYKLDPTINLKYLVSRLIKTNKPVVVDDARYKTELEWFREQGWTIIRINSPQKKKAPSKTLRNGASGTLILQEYYGQDIDADFSIFHESIEGTKKILSEILDTIGN